MCCPKCGNNNDKKNKYCPKCGTQLIVEEKQQKQVYFLNPKIFLILSILSVLGLKELLIETFGLFSSSDFFEYIFLYLIMFIAVMVAFVPVLVLIILNIISSFKKKNTKGLVIAELIISIIQLLWVRKFLDYNITIWEATGLISTLIMIIGYIVKLIKKQY